MESHSLKYIQIRHWNYWWGVYQCGKNNPDCPNAAEFSLTDGLDGASPFFHLDLYNLSGLGDTIQQEEFFEANDPEYPRFLHRAEALQKGEMDYFIGALYYRKFTPDLAFCSQPLTPERTLLDLKSPPTSPDYAVLFLAEERPLAPEVLNCWLARLSKPLFGESLSFAFSRTPSREEALASWKSQTTNEF